MDETVVFREEQRFTQTWLWAVVMLTTVAVWVGLVATMVDPDDDGTAWVVVLVAAVGVGLPVLFALARLTVEVRADRVDIRYRPFTRRTITLHDVAHVQAVTYKPVREYGGWGVKGWSRRKVAYNVQGNRGALLTLRDGRTVLIGSQHPDELTAAIHRGIRTTATP